MFHSFFGYQYFIFSAVKDGNNGKKHFFFFKKLYFFYSWIRKAQYLKFIYEFWKSQLSSWTIINENSWVGKLNPLFMTDLTLFYCQCSMYVCVYMYLINIYILCKNILLFCVNIVVRVCYFFDVFSVFRQIFGSCYHFQMKN